LLVFDIIIRGNQVVFVHDYSVSSEYLEVIDKGDFPVVVYFFPWQSEISITVYWVDYKRKNKDT